MKIEDFLDQWRWVLGYEGRYAIHQSGAVWNVTRGRVQKNSKAITGYFTASIDRKNRLVHVLLLEAFVGPRPEGHDGRHLNDIPWDNRLENLAWGTRSENMADIRRNKNLIGKQVDSPLSYDLADQVRAYRTYDYKYKELAEMFGVSAHSIGFICRGESWVRDRAS